MSCGFCKQTLKSGWVNYGPYQVHWECYYRYFKQQQSRQEVQLPRELNQPVPKLQADESSVN